MALHPLLYLYAGLLGLVVGSYLNVLIYRLPRGRSTIRSRSSCPYCGGSIRAVDNVPLLSFLLLRGRCRRCGAPISQRYPLVEALTALLFILCLWRFGPRPEAAAAALFVSLMLALAAIDLEHHLLPDKLTLPGILAGLLLQPWLPGSWLDAVIGALGGAGLLILVMNFWYWLRGEEGMGMGDVNMLALIGAFLGWKGVLVTLFLATLAGALVGISLMALGRLGLRSKLPFGVFLAGAGVTALFAGEMLLRRYVDLL